MKATALLSPMLRASVTCHSASVSREDIPVERRYGLERQETRPPQSGSAQGLARGSSLLFEGKPSEAEALEEQKVMGVPNRQPPYQPLGNLTIEFSDHDNATDYRRELNLATGVARVTYRIGNATCTREVSSSAPDQALVVRLACDQPGHDERVQGGGQPHSHAACQRHSAGPRFRSGSRTRARPQCRSAARLRAFR